MGVTWLSVPFADKDAVKQIGGARWNPDRRSWYLPDGVNPEPFAAWMCRSERPSPYPGLRSQPTAKGHPDHRHGAENGLVLQSPVPALP